jgi:hypothetical protein
MTSEEIELNYYFYSKTVEYLELSSLRMDSNWTARSGL